MPNGCVIETASVPVKFNRACPIWKFLLRRMRWNWVGVVVRVTCLVSAIEAAWRFNRRDFSEGEIDSVTLGCRLVSSRSWIASMMDAWTSTIKGHLLMWSGAGYPSNAPNLPEANN